MSRVALRRRVDQLDGRHWAVYGREGVVSWGHLPHAREGHDTYGAIKVHTPHPQAEALDPLGGCPYLEGDCYTVSVYVAGHRLGKAWEAAGRDDEVIWSELAKWYRAQLLGGGR